MSEEDELLGKEEKEKKPLSAKIRFAGVLSCMAFIIYTTVVLTKSFSIDNYFLMRLLTEIIPASIILGVLGYSIGKMIDETKSR